MNQIAPTPEPAIRDIPLSRLEIAPENARKTPPDAAAETQLRASIAAHGLLENLVARADEAGRGRRRAIRRRRRRRRRLAALKALAENGTLHADHPVPCKIARERRRGRAVARRERDAHRDAPRRPGGGVLRTRRVRRRGGCHRRPLRRLRAHRRAAAPSRQRPRPSCWRPNRAGGIDLEALKAFAVTTDRDRQRAVWERASSQGYRPSAWQVQRLLTEERVPAGSAIARFVGVDAYEAAGGAVLRDLFADEHENGVWFEDPALLNELAVNKLGTTRRRAGDPLELGRGGVGGGLERDRALRPHPAPARRADGRREGRDRTAAHPPGRALQHGRRRVDRGTGRGGRRHRGPPGGDRRRGRSADDVPPGGFRHRRLHRHHRAATARSRSSRGW